MGLTFNLGRVSPSVFTDSSLNVGIGGSPSGSYKLEVTGTAKVSGNVFLSNGSGNKITTLGGSPSANDGASLELIPSNSARNWAIRANWNVSGALEFVPSTAAGGSSFSTTPSMIISSAGLVGIGSGASGNPAAYGFFAVSNVITVNTLAGVAAGFSDNTYGTTRLYIQNGINGINVDQAFVISTGGGVPVERMRITSGGEIYMGSSTTDKNSRLVVYGSTSDGNTYAFRCYSSGSDILFGVRTDGYINTGNYTSSPYNLVRTGRVMMVDSAGGVGYQSSTRESKTNITNLEDISFIYKLNPVSFNYRKSEGTSNVFTDEYNEDLQYGLIADEVEKVNKELVFYNEKDGVKELAGVEYGKLTAVLIKAIQEQQAQIQSLQEQNQDLKSRLDKAGL